MPVDPVADFFKKKDSQSTLNFRMKARNEPLKEYDVTLTDTMKRPFSSTPTALNRRRKKLKPFSLTPTLSSFPMRILAAEKRATVESDPEFYKMMRERFAIGNCINQLEAKANALGFMDTLMLREEAKTWHEFQIVVRKKYLLPIKAS